MDFWKCVYLSLRLGAMNTEQAFGALVDSVGGTCGIGAVMDGFGELPELNRNGILKILETSIAMPGCDCGYFPDSVASFIIHQNDHHRTPRNQIADKLESLGL